jgi:glucoamylase
MESFTDWLEREYRYAAGAMLASVSAVSIVKIRPGFGQEIRPVPGAIVASPVLASWDPEPDYFFHWYRDSAVVIDALRLLFEAGAIGTEALTHVADFVRFSLSLRELNGNALVTAHEWRKKVSPDFEKYVREDTDLASIHGAAVAADTRVNPNGTLDISRWTRPQFDGPPLRALALLRWASAASFGTDVRAQMADLIRSDLSFALTHWREPSYDIWEEENGQHYYTLCVSEAALTEGAAWLESQSDASLAQKYRSGSEAIRRRLGEFWLPEEGHYRSRVLASGARSTKELDIAVILGAIHAVSDTNVHVVHDPRMQATLARLEALFDELYPINHGRPAGRGPAMGRYAGDVYYSGGAYYFSTLGAAEFCFRAAAGREDAPSWVEKGDAFLATVRAFTPATLELSEQFDQRTGAQTSARHLAWSYAAFISCLHARRAVAGPGR